MDQGKLLMGTKATIEHCNYDLNEKGCSYLVEILLELVVSSWKILGANIHRWANFPRFFQKTICQFPFFIKMIHPNFTI